MAEEDGEVAPGIGMLGLLIEHEPGYGHQVRPVRIRGVVHGAPLLVPTTPRAREARNKGEKLFGGYTADPDREDEMAIRRELGDEVGWLIGCQWWRKMDGLIADNASMAMLSLCSRLVVLHHFSFCL